MTSLRVLPLEIFTWDPDVVLGPLPLYQWLKYITFVIICFLLMYFKIIGEIKRVSGYDL